MDLMEPWREQIAAAVRDGSIESWEPEPDAVAGLLHEAGLRSWMAGNLFVRDIELGDKQLSLALEVTDGTAFLDLPFEEAIARFRTRKVVDPDTFYDINNRMRERMFTATHLLSQQLRKEAFRQLQTALADGMTVDEFAQRIQESQVALGFDRSSHGYLRTVFDTNVASAYNAGRFEQMTQPDVVARVPYRQYRAIIDTHTRASHAALHRTVWRADDPAWHNYVGPNDYNCRCTMIAVEDDDEALGSIEQLLAKPRAHPNERFNQSPGAI